MEGNARRDNPKTHLLNSKVGHPAGNFYLPENAPWVNDFIEEAAQFPNGSHDDQVDAWSQAAARFRASAHSGIFEYYQLDDSQDDTIRAALQPTQI